MTVSLCQVAVEPKCAVAHLSGRICDVFFCHSRSTVHVILPSLLRWNRSTSKTTNCQGNVTTFVIGKALSVQLLTYQFRPLAELCSLNCRFSLQQLRGKAGGELASGQRLRLGVYTRIKFTAFSGFQSTSRLVLFSVEVVCW